MSFVPNSGDRDRRNSAQLRGQSANRGRGSVNGGGGGGGQFDASGFVLGELLGMYGQEGQWQPGSAATRVSRAGERAAVRGNYDRAEGDRASNYAFIRGDVLGRNPKIRANFDNATADLRGNAAQRAIETRAALAAREQDSATAAANLGLAVNPGATARAGEVAEGGIARTNSNAESWAGFNAGAGERAVERNTGVADAFEWQGQQQRQQLADTMMQLLAGLQDYTVGGSSGRFVGGLSDSERFKALGMIDDIGNSGFKRELDSAKLMQGTNWG